MKQSKHYSLGVKKYLAIILLVFPVLTARAQEDTPDDDFEKYKLRARELVNYLQGTLNFLGDHNSTSKEKEIIINESYKKIFRDDKVQIEDDLDESRVTPINKDVQAYLKDVDFFFEEVNFDFNIEEITHSVNDSKQIYLKIQLNRNLSGKTISGDTINSNQPRFIELNLNEETNDLKIVSIYTTRLNEEQELKNWWHDLPIAWKEIFLRNLPPADSITITHVKIIQDIHELDVSGNNKIEDLRPLSAMSELEVLDCSNTGITNLFPLRSLAKIKYLDCNNTSIANLSPLKYSIHLETIKLGSTFVENISVLANFTSLKYLECNHTHVSNIEALAGLISLRQLYLQNTRIKNIEPISDLTSLQELALEGTNINTVEPLQRLINLEFLNLNYTRVISLEALSSLVNLKTLYINNTLVRDLEPLLSIPALEKIYCDNTLVTKEAATRFMNIHESALVVFASSELKKWWTGLSPGWKQIMKGYVEISTPPTTEELHQLSNIKTVEIKENSGISSLEPLQVLDNLEKLTCRGNQVNDISVLNTLKKLEYLDISHTPVSSILPLNNLKNLEYLNIGHTGVEDLQPLVPLENLNYLNAEYTPVQSIKYIYNLKDINTLIIDSTQVPVEEIHDFIRLNINTKVIYRTEELKNWWYGLPPHWQEIFRTYVATGKEPDSYALHEITYLPAIKISSNYKVKNLVPLIKLNWLKSLVFIDTRITELSPLEHLVYLEDLDFSNNPVENTFPLRKLVNLSSLSMENTPVEDISAIGNLQHIEVLNISGTRINNLKSLEKLTELIQLDCYNTRIMWLNPIIDHEKIELLRCYNTRLIKFSVERFKSKHPDCEVIYY